MATRIALKHTTTYSYGKSVWLSPQLIRLRPAPHCRTEIQSYNLTIAPHDHLVHWQQDPFNNYVARASFPNKVTELTLQVDITANIVEINPFDFLIDDAFSTWPFQYPAELKQDLQSYLGVQEHGDAITVFLESLPGDSMGIVDFLLLTNTRIFEQLEYGERLEPGVQHSNESLGMASGSCRDYAWLLVQIFRHLGLAARFVSGYSIQLKDDSVQGPGKIERDSTDLHAWTEVFVPGAGWIGLDSTSGLLAGAGYIPLCCTRTPASAAALSGTSEPSQTQFSFENTITRLPNE